VFVADGYPFAEADIRLAVEAACERLRPNVAAIVRLRASGFIAVEVAEMLGVSESYISHVLRSARPAVARQLAIA
jgi:DNA-directed RNA polymerase specialized sigma24 family protein